MQAIVGEKRSMFHIHRWHYVKTVGSAAYFTCRCGDKKTVYYEPNAKTIRWSWLSNQSKTLNRTPRKDNGDE